MFCVLRRLQSAQSKWLKAYDFLFFGLWSFSSYIHQRFTTLHLCLQCNWSIPAVSIQINAVWICRKTFNLWDRNLMKAALSNHIINTEPLHFFLTKTNLRMKLTTPSDLQPPTHQPTAISDGVKAWHLHVHMNNSGLYFAFLCQRQIYKSACTISDLHISGYLWTLCAFVSVHIYWHFTVHMLAGHKHVQVNNNNVHHFLHKSCLSLDGLLNWTGSFAF